MASSISIQNGIRYIESQSDSANPVGTYLFVHGLGGSLEHWAKIIRPVGLTARAIAIDVPGFGQSRTVSKSFDLEHAVEQILDFCHSKSISECVLVSHSIGCVIAARLLTLKPALFTRFVMISGTLTRAVNMAQRPQRMIINPRLALYVVIVFAAGSMPISRPVLRALMNSSILRRVTLWPFIANPNSVIPDDLIQTLVNSGSLVVPNILLTASSIDYRKIMSEIGRPVELIWGAEDHLINHEDIVSARQVMTIQRERMIRECGHWPWLEKPAEIIDFITSRSSDGARTD